MKQNFIRYSIYSMAALLIGLVVLAASRANAQRSRTNEIDVLSYSWGVSSGQQARINLVNFGDEPIIANIQLLDKEGKAFALSGEIQVAPAHTYIFDYMGFTGGVSVDFKRDALPLAGERAQVRAQVRYRSFYLVDRTRAIGFLPTSVELIDDDTGHSTLLISQKPKEIVVVGSNSPAIAPAQTLTDLPVIVYGGRALMGLAYGQKLRVNAFYPGNPADPQRQSVRARARLYDANGALLAQSA
jgi:hypothetical protein